MSFKDTEIGLLPNEWGFDSIKDSLYIKGRIGWKGLKKSEYLDHSNFRIINGSNIIDNKIDWGNCGYISKERYEESPEIMLQENDIVMTKDGTIGKLAVIKNLSQKSTVASGLFVIRIEENSIDVDYLYSYFTSQFFKSLIKSRIEGSVIPHLYQRDLVELKIPLPKIEEQKAISSILSTLDKKIENNNQINKTLENMAQAIFKQWFVDFEFPNENGEPYKTSGGKMVESELGMIPEGWEVKLLSDYVTVKYGKDHKKLNDGNIPVYGSGGIMRYAEKHLYDKESVLIPRKGTLNNVMLVDQPFWSVDTMFYTEMNLPNISKFIYLFMKSKDLLSMNTGSAVPSMTTKLLNSMKIIGVPMDALNNFDEVVTSLYVMIYKNEKQTKVLEGIRDTLLPKLMSGEIRVPIEE